MNFGMPTLIELEGLEANISLCNELGLDFIEINMNLPAFQAECLDAEVLNELKTKHKMYFTFHLPEDLDVGHFNKRIREANLKIVEDTIQLASRIDAPLINMHMNNGIYFTLPNRKVELYEKFEEEYLRNILASSSHINQMLKGTGVKLAIENTGIYHKPFIRKAVEMFLEETDCYLTWDIGHDYSSGKKDEAFMLIHKERMKHMHLHDAIGERNHLELFTGEIDLPYFFDLAKENNCSCVVETKTIEALKNSTIRLLNRDKGFSLT